MATTTTSASAGGLPERQHLEGSGNYNDWKFAMRMFLIDARLWDTVTMEVTDQGFNADKDQRALAKMCLSVKPNAYAHVRNEQTSKSAWTKLQTAYEDSGLSRRLGLLTFLMAIRFSNFKSMEEYVNKIMTTAQQLRDVKRPIDDELVGALMLAGLPKEYKPLILGLEGSGKDITSDLVKSLLLQEDVRNEFGSDNCEGESAYAIKYGKKKFQNRNFKNWKPFNSKDGNHQKDHFQKKGEFDSKYDKKPTYEKKGNRPAFHAALGARNNEENWYIDSGAAKHLTSRQDWLNNFEDTKQPDIIVANNEHVKCHGKGDVSLALCVDNQTSLITAHDVTFAPGLSTNLLSVSQMVKKGLTVLFDCDGGYVLQGKVPLKGLDIVATASENCGMYQLDQNNQIVCTVKKEDSGILWHQRLGHLNRVSMRLLKDKMSVGIEYEGDLSKPCIECIKGKQHREPFPKTKGKRAKEKLALVHSDVCGPMSTKSIGGARYILTFTDDMTRKSFVYFLQFKSEVAAKFKEFKAMVENETGNRIVTLRTDNGTEYVNADLQHFLKENGIHHQLTVAYTPEQNGVAERLNRTIVEKGRSMLLASELGTDFWAEAAATAVHLKNRSPTKSLKDMTPEEAWSGKKPDLNYLRVFGCKAMVHIPKQKRKKWDSKSEELIFTGYCDETKGYRLVHPASKKLVVARDIIFLEGVQNERNSYTENIEVDPQPNGEVERPVCTEQLNSANPDAEDNVPETVKVQERRYPQRECRQPKKFEDFVTYRVAMCREADPNTIEEAMNRPDSIEWEKAMDEEFKSHLDNETWTLVDLPEGRKAINSKWIFKTKLTVGGNIERYKARLVAKGCSQKPGIDYEETYSPVVRYSSVRFLCSLAAKYDLDLDQMDAVTAFLQGELEEEVYMHQPEGFVQRGHENKVCRLSMAIYGLKQASLVWNKKLDTALKEIGLERSKVDSCVYFKIVNDKILIVAVYVDDLLIASNNDTDKHLLKRELMKRFKMKDLGEAHFCLGMRIVRDRSKGTISIDQENYIEGVLERFGMKDSKPAITPLDPNQKLSKEMQPVTESEKLEMSKIPYQEAIGSIMFAAQGTRPDIAQAVGELSRFNNNPGKPHWIAVKRILRYLRGTSTCKLEFSKSGEPEIVGYSDADWASNIDDRRSVTGYVFIMNGGAITWNSKRQATVALSTTEAEYMALSSATQEAMWLSALQAELDAGTEPVMMIYCDNRSAIDLSVTSGYRARTKHIDIRHHFIREKVNEGVLQLMNIGTEYNISDILTKGLFGRKHLWCSENMGLKFKDMAK